SSLLGYLPFTLEWNAVGILLFLSALVSPRTLVIGALPLVVSFGLAVATAARARVDPRFAGPASRALIALLTYLGPLVRGIQRYLWRLRGLGQVGRIAFEGEQQPPRIDYLRRGFTVGYWSEQGHEKEALLAALMDFFIPRKYLIAVDPGWNRWDLEIYRGVWSKARLTVAAENHGGSKRLLMGSTVRLVRKILGRLVPYRWLFASALVQVLLIGIFELAKPWPLKVIVDDVLGGRPLGWPGLGTLGGPALLALACLALVAI